MLARLRPIYNQIIVPLGRLSARLGISANAWTLFSLVTAFIAAYFLIRGNFWLGLGMVVVMNLADTMDGATARFTGTASRFGTVLDHVIDRYAEFVIISGLLIGGWISPAAAMFSSSGIIMASYVRAKAESAGGIKECTVGFAGRAEKLILIYGSLALLGLGFSTLAEIFIWIAGVISHITAIQRLLYTRDQLKNASSR